MAEPTSTPSCYRLLGGPASPYSLKLRAILRYRRLSHTWAVPRGFFLDAPELVQAGKRFVPVLQYPEDGTYHADSTPLAFELERRHPGERSIIPPTAEAAFLSHLIETLADEWLVFAMFHYKWHLDVDGQFCGQRQVLGWLGPLDDPTLEMASTRFRDRQTELLTEIGVDGSLVPLFEATYTEILNHLDNHLKRQPFLFGDRPSLGDFGLYGPLSQCAIDPTAARIMRERSPRVFSWVQLLDDASGLDGDWADINTRSDDGLKGLLAICGEVLLPLMEAQLSADRSEAEVAVFHARGAERRRRRSAYQARCLLWLRAELREMDKAARERLKPMLTEAGCWMPLQTGPMDEEETIPMLPR